jgi:hypothetical protein
LNEINKVAINRKNCSHQNPSSNHEAFSPMPQKKFKKCLLISQQFIMLVSNINILTHISKGIVMAFYLAKVQFEITNEQGSVFQKIRYARPEERDNLVRARRLEKLSQWIKRGREEFNDLLPQSTIQELNNINDLF